MTDPEVQAALTLAAAYERNVKATLDARLPPHSPDCDEAWTSGRCLRCDVLAGISVAFGFARPLAVAADRRTLLAYVGGHPETPLHPYEASGTGTCLACERHETATGAALASALMAANYPGDSGEDVDRLIAELGKRGYVLASAALPDSGAGREGLDVERLVRAMEDVFPGWLEEAPGTAEAQAEMRSYAEQLDVAYRRLADSASPPAALGAGREGLDVERWIESLHEDAHGSVWTTKAELAAALGAGSTDEVRRLLDDANNVVNTEWAKGNVSHDAAPRILNALNKVRAALTDKPSPEEPHG